MLSCPGLWPAPGKMEDFHTYDRILPVVIHNDARRDLPRLDDLGIIQPSTFSLCRVRLCCVTVWP